MKHCLFNKLYVYKCSNIIRSVKTYYIYIGAIFEWKVKYKQYDRLISRNLHEDGTEKHVCKQVSFCLKRTRSFVESCKMRSWEKYTYVWSEMCGPKIKLFLRHPHAVCLLLIRINYWFITLCYSTQVVNLWLMYNIHW